MRGIQLSVMVRIVSVAALIHLADFLCRREKIGDGGGERLPKLDPAALRTFGIHEEPRAALKRIFGYGEELQREMETADAFTSIVREDEDAAEEEEGQGTSTEGAGAADGDQSPEDPASNDETACQDSTPAAGDDDA